MGFKVLKFGGTSVGSAERMKQVASIIDFAEPKIVVLSAVSGTTNSLVEISEVLSSGKKEEAQELISTLHEKYQPLIHELFSTEAYTERGRMIVAAHINYIRSFVGHPFSLFQEREILAQGELISTALFNLYLESIGRRSVLLPALNFMRIDTNEEPDLDYIYRNIQREMLNASNTDTFITQGYICRNSFGEVDNLKRGGSDYTASLIGAAIQADEIQIWTDIDGMHNNDPRVVDRTRPIAEISFDEAAELAYFGAKILHPQSVLPAKKANVPVLLKNTIDPDAKGTVISETTRSSEQVKAIAAKDKITAIKIKSARMLMAYGFLRSVFEVFERYKTPIDMISTSEVAISLTIDNLEHLDEIKQELELFGIVEIDHDLTIVCVVGNMIAEIEGAVVEILAPIRHIPIRMISYGGSRHNVSLLIKSEHKESALQALNEKLFDFDTVIS